MCSRPFSFWASSPKPETPPDSGDAIFSTETRLVPLNVTVTDKSGRLVTNLPQSAFQVFENGVLQTIRLFRREDVPVSMGLIIDNSGSMREKRQAVEMAALALVKAAEEAERAAKEAERAAKEAALRDKEAALLGSRSWKRCLRARGA